MHEDHQISASNRDEELARILRVRVTRSIEIHDLDSAANALQQLEVMAGTIRSDVIELSYHGAAGALLVAQGKFDEAIPHLEEGNNDPESMRLLWRIYSSN